MSRPQKSAAASAVLIGAAVVALACIGSVAVVVGAHIGDTYHVDHVAGAWLTLGRDVVSGVFYPRLFDGTDYGGTRYMPLQFVLYGVVGWLGDDYLVGPKVLAALTFAALLVLLYRVLRSKGCGGAVSLALLAAVSLSFPGFFAATSTYADTLPVILQLAAVALIARSQRSAVLAGAAALCALAVLTKLTALWAPAAIIVWLVVRRPRRALLFLGAYLALVVASIAILELLSDGRLLANVAGLAFSGSSSAAAPLTDAPQKLYEIARDRAVVLFFLAPFAAAAIVIQARNRSLSIYSLSLLFAIPILLVILGDQGTDFNHLVDLVVLTAVCAGEFAAIATQRSPTILLPAMTVLILVGVLGSYDSGLRADLHVSASTLLRRHPQARFNRSLTRAYVSPSETLLSEDPTVPLLLDRRPTILDAFMLRPILEAHPKWRDSLIRRLDERRFDKIVLIADLDLSDSWWRDHHFGLPTARAISRNYCKTQEVLGGVFKYRIYEPRGIGVGCAEQATANSTVQMRRSGAQLMAAAARRSHTTSVTTTYRYTRWRAVSLMTSAAYQSVPD